MQIHLNQTNSNDNKGCGKIIHANLNSHGLPSGSYFEKYTYAPLLDGYQRMCGARVSESSNHGQYQHKIFSPTVAPARVHLSFFLHYPCVYKPTSLFHASQQYGDNEELVANMV